MHFYYLRFYAPTAYAVGYILPPLRGWATEQTDDYVVAAGTTVADAVVALTADAFKEAIRVSARGAGLTTMDLPSGAGHDAQNVARFAPMGMIFVPSRGGISHSPLEYTSPEQAANGAEVLYRAVLRLDLQLDEKPKAQN